MLLVRSLWGPWIAAYFAILNFPWIEASILGGSEPLFVFLRFASFWFSRKDRWITASALAALATLTRPVGIFGIFALGFALLFRREYRKLSVSTGVAALLGFLYLVPFWIAFHDPLYQFHRYEQEDWQSGHLLTWPFQIMTMSYLYYRGPWTNVFLTGGGLCSPLWGSISWRGSSFANRGSRYLNEQIFAIAY